MKMVSIARYVKAGKAKALVHSSYVHFLYTESGLPEIQTLSHSQIDHFKHRIRHISHFPHGYGQMVSQSNLQRERFVLA